MDVLSFELEPHDPRVTAQVVDATGERCEVLRGEAAERVLEAGAPLLAAHAGAHGARVSVDVRATAPGPAIAPLVQVVARAIVSELLARPPLPTDLALDAAFWSGLYADGRDGWELGRAAPPLSRWAAVRDLRGRHALVVGCGRGHEARLLARAGARVVAVDYAPQAVADARALAAAQGVDVDFRERDVFELARDPERYDLVVEHCCFCAIDPARRAEYARVIAEVTAPGGTYVALFFTHGRPGGPPFATTRDEVERLFADDFVVEELEVPADSVAARLGHELRLTMRRRATSTPS